MAKVKTFSSILSLIFLLMSCSYFGRPNNDSKHYLYKIQVNTHNDLKYLKKFGTLIKSGEGKRIYFLRTGFNKNNFTEFLVTDSNEDTVYKYD